MLKTCHRCKKKKDIKQFYKDNRSADGHRGTCSSCCKLMKQIVKAKFRGAGTPIAMKPLIPTKRLEKIPEPSTVNLATIPINFFSELSKKLNAHYSISIARDGKCHIQSHGEIQRTWKAQNFQELLQMVGS